MENAPGITKLGLYWDLQVLSLPVVKAEFCVQKVLICGLQPPETGNISFIYVVEITKFNENIEENALYVK